MVTHFRFNGINKRSLLSKLKKDSEVHFRVEIFNLILIFSILNSFNSNGQAQNDTIQMSAGIIAYPFLNTSESGEGSFALGPTIDFHNENIGFEISVLFDHKKYYYRVYGGLGAQFISNFKSTQEARSVLVPISINPVFMKRHVFNLTSKIGAVLTKRFEDFREEAIIAQGTIAFGIELKVKKKMMFQFMPTARFGDKFFMGLIFGLKYPFRVVNKN